MDAGWDARQFRRFLEWCAGVALLLITSVVALNLWVDATGQLGTGMIDPMAELPRDRRAKAALLERAEQLDLVVLGSSRSKRIEPARLEPGARGVNAAVVASDMFEQRVLTTWLARRAVKQDTPFPHLVLGVDVEQWRHSSLRTSGLLAVPELARIAREEAGATSSLRSIAGELDDLLLTWSATRESVAALVERRRAARAADQAAGNTDAPTLTRDVDEFRSDGLLHADARWDTPAGRRKLRAELPAALRTLATEYGDRYVGSGTEPDPAAVRDFDAMVKEANALGDVPTVVLTPMHPQLARLLARDGRTKRLARVREVLGAAERAGRIDVIDCSRCIPAAADNWVDGVHMTPAGARRLASIVRRRMQPFVRE